MCIQNTLQRTLDSYTIQLESVDSAQPTSVEYISSDTQTTENGIAIHFNDTFEQRRIWSYIVKGLACGGITLSNPGQISKLTKNEIISILLVTYMVTSRLVIQCPGNSL